MKLKSIKLKNFRRFEDAAIEFEDAETIFVGPNNSGKTSIGAAFRVFLGMQSFKIHDFSVSRILDMDKITKLDDEVEKTFPAIEMDIWFNIEPGRIEYGRVSDLVHDVSRELLIVGIRLTYSVKNLDSLLDDYKTAFPDENAKPLSHYLSLSGNLSKHFEITYSSLNKTESNEEQSYLLESSDGKRILRSLIRIDFVDAQRNIEDQESARSNRLSAAFATFYKNNLEQASVSEEANRVIDENNTSLTEHYAEHFEGLMKVIQGLGVPSIADREIRIASSLSPDTVLQGNTSLFYADPDLDHELPEAYNGLGYKNLVYMAIQISHFHLQWIRTEKNRPLFQLIFIEEPEVHLHAQVQQTFVKNIWEIVKNAAESNDEPELVPQLVITTHSSHILDTIEFEKVRYFRRCALEGEDRSTVRKLHASEIMNLNDFSIIEDPSEHEKLATSDDVIKFLKKYIKLTHCDLFFADAAILVEGTVEKMLLPQMIEQCAPDLRKRYITILEVGGAYAHRFTSLLEFIGLPYLIITDLDSVDPSDGRKKCRADTPDCKTSNACIKAYLCKTLIREIIATKADDHILENDGYIAFQKQTVITGYSSPKQMLGRTFEETFIYQNIELFRDGSLESDIDFPSPADFQLEYQAIYDQIQSKSFKKTEFALDIAMSDCSWNSPEYIKDGLCWLEKKMS